ncbi:MAG TPA: pyruvate:ferredoxin (flavodoxin) oxidoreductase [Candidatus Hydrogenedentes bacterium]|nr:pyruvate:ferredoxin (flavodoxin) oxidoreductase [Candidatus Hydrogenedentota bacterium]HPG66576.1 pyruvate:ferredoxin (flavodoxin) oxidoreductase [Candidatus Hydrogenedentota bacterium]
MANKVMIDGNTAAATMAHAVSEVCAIYPITPSSVMGEVADELSAAGVKNIFNTIPQVVELQSEAGAAGAVHGALTSGALTTTFTASQGLLLMIPNMFKIAGELCSTVFHVSARAVACQALSIFGDHSDIMTARSTGFALLGSSSIQEVQDFAIIAHAATLETRVPFVHFFDGFRSSHEVQKIDELPREAIAQMISEDLVLAHRKRGMTPDAPVLRGTSQNPDVYFQGRETVNKYYAATPGIVQKQMDKFAKLTGRQYRLFDYVGAPDAEKVIVVMGSGAETCHETVDYLCSKGEKVGVIKIRLYRPFDTKAFIAALPKTVRAIATLDRTKEPGAIGEPIYLDVRTAIGEAQSEKWLDAKSYPRVLGGRYGLGSKDFTPAMVKAVFDNLDAEKPKNHFTVGITDDVTNTSLDIPRFGIEQPGLFECMFFGLGADGTVGANKNSIKIIGTDTDHYAQGYFVYDSKKAGGATISHLRFGPNPIQSPYLCTKADFVACHNFSFLEKYDLLSCAKEGAVFLLNSPFSADEVWNRMPDEVEQQIIAKKIKFYVIDAIALAKDLGLGARINTIMQTCFFAISGVLPTDQAIASLKKAIKKSYGRKGDEVVQMNFKAVDAAVDSLHQVKVPDRPAGKLRMPPAVPAHAPDFVKAVTAPLICLEGDKLPVSAMPPDGTWPTATTQYEKRNVAVDIPVWEPGVCLQCGMCSLVCPHAAIRIKLYTPDCLEKAPATFKSVDAKGKEYAGMRFTVQVAPEDCTGCGACVHTCPGKERDGNKQETGRHAINMATQMPLRVQEAANFDFFMSLPDLDPSRCNLATVKGSQLVRPLFEFSGSCAGCGETPYVKLMTQLFGDRLMVGNATGCSSIYGGNLPTTPYAKRADGRGPAWSNSLFEDAAEFAFGMRLAVDKFREAALELVEQSLACEECPFCKKSKDLLIAIRDADQSSQSAIEEQRKRVAELKAALCRSDAKVGKQLLSLADYLVKKSIWGLGGDGWAYDIGYGGLDHVLASGRNINLLVLDTEVYSNTGGQASKSTPLGAVAKFAAAGKPQMKKDMGLMCISYGNIYVAKVAMGANPAQAVRAFAEAEAYDGPSIIIAYSHCIAHGIDMVTGMDEQKRAVESGHFPLYRYNPDLVKQGKNPLQLDSKPPKMKYSEFAMGENRFRSLKKTNPENVERFMNEGDRLVAAKYDFYSKLAAMEPYTPQAGEGE